MKNHSPCNKKSCIRNNKTLENMIDCMHTMEMMRRTDRLQSEEFGRGILAEAQYGVLSLVDGMHGDVKPYAIPISHALADNTIYIHGASEGTKLRLIADNNHVAFTCVGKTHLLPAQFSTEYESVVVTGRAAIVEDMEEKRRGLMALARKYSPEFEDEAVAYIERALGMTSLIAISIESITAKAKLPK